MNNFVSSFLNNYAFYSLSCHNSLARAMLNRSGDIRDTCLTSYPKQNFSNISPLTMMLAIGSS